MSASRPPRLRTGRRVERHLYLQLGPRPSDDDPVAGTVETADLAAAIVARYNEIADSGPPGRDPSDIAVRAVNRLCAYDAIGAPGDYRSTAIRAEEFMAAFTRLLAERLAGTIDPAPAEGPTPPPAKDCARAALLLRERIRGASEPDTRAGILSVASWLEALPDDREVPGA